MIDRKPDFIGTHAHPAWRSQANHIFKYVLSDSDGRLEWEQMWGKRTDGGSTLLCCIPFFAYDLSLGDTVLISDDDYFIEVKECSKNVTTRVWTKDIEYEERELFRKDILRFVDNAEMHSDYLFALSVNVETFSFLQYRLDYYVDKLSISYEISNSND